MVESNLVPEAELKHTWWLNLRDRLPRLHLKFVILTGMIVIGIVLLGIFKPVITRPTIQLKDYQHSPTNVISATKIGTLSKIGPTSLTIKSGAQETVIKTTESTKYFSKTTSIKKSNLSAGKQLVIYTTMADKEVVADRVYQQ